MSDTLRLQTNIAETIALEYADGFTVNGKFGDQVLFTLTDGRKLYVAPFVAQKIYELGVAPGEEFVICKRETTQGNRRVVQYEVSAAVPAEPLANTAAVRRTPSAVSTPHEGTPTVTRGTNETRTTATHQPVRGAVAVMPAPIAEPRTTATDLPVRSAAPPVSDPSAVAVMKMAGIAAVDAVLAIEEYARSKGMTDFMFGADNLQRIAVSLYIDMRKGGRA